MSKKLGFIGIGRMGAPMARRLIAAGYDVTVYDPSEAAMAELEKEGAHPVASPVAVANVVETVLLSLPTPDIVNAVATGEDGLVNG